MCCILLNENIYKLTFVRTLIYSKIWTMSILDWTLEWHLRRSALSSYLADQQVQCTVGFYSVIYQCLWKVSLFTNDNTIDICTMGHSPIFFAFSDSTWTRPSVDSGLDMEGHLTGLHDTLTLPLDFWLRGHVKTLVYSEPIGDLKIL
jgi:hypothetical protein